MRKKLKGEDSGPHRLLSEARVLNPTAKDLESIMFVAGVCHGSLEVADGLTGNSQFTH